MFGNPASSPGFGTPSTPSFTPAFGSSPFFSTPANTVSPFSQQPQPQQQTPSPFSFQTPTPSSSHFGAPAAPSPFMNPQLTTQMAPVAPLPFSLADRDIQVYYYSQNPSRDFTKTPLHSIVFVKKTLIPPRSLFILHMGDCLE